METKISIFKSTKESSKPINSMAIRDVLFSKRNKQKIELLRMLPKECEEAAEIKLSLPCFTSSGIFSTRNVTGLVKHSGTICIEWDNVEQPEVLKEKLHAYNFIWYAGLSCSGRGVFALVNVLSPEKHREYFRALRKFFDDEGIPIDPSGSDVTRLRIASYDESYYLNNFALLWDSVLPSEPIKEYEPRNYKGENIDQKLFLCGLEYIERYGIDITTGRNNWLALGSMVKTLFGDMGEEYFISLSRYHLKFNELEAHKTWGDVRSGGYGIGVFCRACSRAGVPNLNEMFAAQLKIKRGYE